MEAAFPHHSLPAATGISLLAFPCPKEGAESFWGGVHSAFFYLRNAFCLDRDPKAQRKAVLQGRAAAGLYLPGLLMTPAGPCGRMAVRMRREASSR